MPSYVIKSENAAELFHRVMNIKNSAFEAAAS